VLFTQINQKSHQSHLEELISLCFYPKYHYELNFIKQYWGAEKFHYRTNNVKACLDDIPDLQIKGLASQ
ncbi:hypothetical protein BYT27DRAFT_7029891, partial [Phlegmacium glaucopus]